MQTLDEWKTVLAKDLLELQYLEGQDAATRMRRSMKEQEIGQHCCQAGASLSDPDLTVLKEPLGLDEQHWHAYQSKVRPEPAEADAPTGQFILHATAGRALHPPASPG